MFVVVVVVLEGITSVNCMGLFRLDANMYAQRPVDGFIDRWVCVFQWCVMCLFRKWKFVLLNKNTKGDRNRKWIVNKYIRNYFFIRLRYSVYLFFICKAIQVYQEHVVFVFIWPLNIKCKTVKRTLHINSTNILITKFWSSE